MASLGDPTHGGAFVANAPLGSLSQASTAVHAAQFITASGRTDVSAPSTASRSATSSARWSAAITSSPDAVAAPHDVPTELPAGPGDEQPHLRTPRRGLQRLPPLRLARYHCDGRCERLVEIVLRSASRAPRSCRS